MTEEAKPENCATKVIKSGYNGSDIVDGEGYKQREGLKKKIRNYLGIFPKCRTPPPTPPFWEPLVQKKKLWFILRFRP